MDSLLLLVFLIIVWFVVNKWLLPKLGMPT
jgi:hypothetical protein